MGRSWLCIKILATIRFWSTEQDVTVAGLSTSDFAVCCRIGWPHSLSLSLLGRLRSAGLGLFGMNAQNVLAIIISAFGIQTCVALRTLKWNFTGGTQNLNLFDSNFVDQNSVVINFACSDQEIARFYSALSGGYVQGDDNIAQNTYNFAICSLLLPGATGAKSWQNEAVKILSEVTTNYATFSLVTESPPFRRYCYTFDLLKPYLNATFQKAFADFAEKLISDATKWDNPLKKDPDVGNHATSVAALRGVCAQAINNLTAVEETKNIYISYLLSLNENVYQNGTTYDFYHRDALFYQVEDLKDYLELALRMPDGFYTQDQWVLLERATYFLKQFYIPVCLPHCVYHREFMATLYPIDQTTLHPDLYCNLWPVSNVSGNGSADAFFEFARIPFVSVRSWTDFLASKAYYTKHSSNVALLAIPYGIYVGAATFGPFDSADVDLGKVAAYTMRSIDFPNSTVCGGRTSLETGSVSPQGPSASPIPSPSRSRAAPPPCTFAAAKLLAGLMAALLVGVLGDAVLPRA